MARECRRGHRISGGNVFVRKNGTAECLRCKRARDRGLIVDSCPHCGRKKDAEYFCHRAGKPMRYCRSCRMDRQRERLGSMTWAERFTGKCSRGHSITYYPGRRTGRCVTCESFRNRIRAHLIKVAVDGDDIDSIAARYSRHGWDVYRMARTVKENVRNNTWLHAKQRALDARQLLRRLGKTNRGILRGAWPLQTLESGRARTSRG